MRMEKKQAKDGNTRCKNCLWFDKCCCDNEQCDDYSPIDICIDEVIEQGRYEFRDDFYDYIDKFYNED